MALDPSAGPPRGFPFLPTLVFILVVLLFVGLGVPGVRAIQARRVAADAFRDVTTLQGAASAYLLERGAWPPSIPTDGGPGPLASFLPSGFAFQREQYDVSFQHWPIPGGLPPGGDSVSVIAISLRASTPAVGREVLRALGPGIGRFTVGETTTFILEGLLQRPAR